MNDELPEAFERIPARPAPRELRARVLATVERELSRRRKPRWECGLEWAAAACVVLGVGLNVGNWWVREHWQARVFAPSAVSTRFKDLTDALASVTDAQAARAVVGCYSTSFSVRRPRATYPDDRYWHFLEELSNSERQTRS